MLNQDPQPIFDAQAANGVGRPILVTDVRTTVISLATAGNFAGTVKFAMSLQQEAPNFALPPSPTNRWDFVRVIDLQDGSTIAGDDGVVLTANTVRNLEMDTNGANWLTAIVSGYTAGQLFVDAVNSSNE